MKFLVGIDDTDIKGSRGTGFKSRMLAQIVSQSGAGNVLSISRHQLLIDPKIPYTSQNSSACLEIVTTCFDELKSLCIDYLMNESEEGSDTGLCISSLKDVTPKMIQWGNHAKKYVLEKDIALEVIKDSNAFLLGLKGSHSGIIGALAAVGLRAGGNDGRIIWLKGEKNLRELKGIYLISELKKIIPVDGIIDKNGRKVNHECQIKLGNWIRPVIRGGKKYIIAEEVTNNESYEWESAHKDFVRSVS